MASLLFDVARVASYRQATVALKGWMSNGRGFDNNFNNSYDDIMTKLKLLGKIQPMQKLDVNNLCLQPEGWGTTLYRTFVSPNSRNDTLSFAKTVISNAFLILEAKINNASSDDKYLCREIIADLLQCQCGLSNLRQTYATHPYFVSALDTMVTADLQVPLAKFKEKHNDLFPDISPKTPTKTNEQKPRDKKSYKVHTSHESDSL
jgi:hypothetical protein